MWRRVVALVVVPAVVLGWVGASAATNDPYFADQWALDRINAPAAWRLSTGAGVRIGVVDTGIDLSHEDLAGKVVASTSCIGAGIEAACAGSAQDDQGHGTHVSGIAAALTGNGKGIAAVAPDAQLVVVKALGASGSGALNDVNAGIKWVVDHGARIVNLSLESDGSTVTATPGQSLKDGVEYAWSNGAIPVLAAGNSTPSLFGQTGYQGIDAVVVGATGRSDEVAWYSSPLTNAQWGLVAPGGDVRDSGGHPSCAGTLAAGCVVSTGWFAGHVNQYADDEGTSMAAPHVSGVLALLLAQGLSPTAAIDRLLSSTARLSCGVSCRGRLDAAAAVGARVVAPTTTTVTPATTAPPPTVTQTLAPPTVTVGVTQPAITRPPVTVTALTPPETAPAVGRRPSAVGLAASRLPTHRGVTALPVAIAVLALVVVTIEARLVLQLAEHGHDLAEDRDI
ncbi:MAG: S8 family serine peptidase [Acidimicrobiales bacterium]